MSQLITRRMHGDPFPPSVPTRQPISTNTAGPDTADVAAAADVAAVDVAAVDVAAIRRYTAVRIGLGAIWGIDATLKWLPGFRHHYLSVIADAAHGQPAWLSGWFAFWGHLVASAPTTVAILIALAETAICVSLIAGVAQRVAFAGGIIVALLIWGVGEGFGGPYTSGATDIGAAIMYAAMLAALWLAIPRTVRAAAPAADHFLARHRGLRWTTFT